MSGYEKIKALARERKCKVTDLLVMAPKNDPFYTGGDASKEKAWWFAELWQRFGYTMGVHLRRVHYHTISQEEPVKRHDGKPYENTERDWDYLCQAGKYARDLGLVDVSAFVDRRNPEPIINCNPFELEEPGIVVDFKDWHLPVVDSDLSWSMDWQLPCLQPVGYDYVEDLQPYHLEVWVEKSTQEDIILPVCKEYGANVITGLGFMSITSVNKLLDRISRTQKPCRILYVADFDPAGEFMPGSVARQLEFWLEKKELDYDVKLQPIMLNQDQVERHNLPRTPIKEKDLRRTGFEQRYGTGAVELDALAALHPGEFRRVLEESILQFRDPELQHKVSAVRRRAYQNTQAAVNEHLGPYQERLQEIKHQVGKVTKSYQERLEELQLEMEQELGPSKGDLESLRKHVEEELERIEVALPLLPEPETSPDHEGWLFDSRRDYFDQLDYYKADKRRGC